MSPTTNLHPAAVVQHVEPKTLIIVGHEHRAAFLQASEELRGRVDLILVATLEDAIAERTRLLERLEGTGREVVIARAADFDPSRRKLSDPMPQTPALPRDHGYYVARAEAKRQRRAAKRAENARRTLEGRRCV